MYKVPKRLLAASTLSIFLFSNSAFAADHFILDGTSVDYKLSIDGSDDLTIKEDGGNGITIADTTGDVTTDGALTVNGASATVSDGTFSVTDDSATTNAVIDVASINASTSGTVANNFGVGLTFDAEDLGGIEEQGSLDLVLTDVTDASEDSQFVFSVQEAGSIVSELTISGGGITLAGGATVNEIETTLSASEDTHIPTSKAVADYVGSNGDNLGDHTATTTLTLGGNDIDGTNFDVTGSNGNTTIGGTLDVSGSTGIDGDFDINTDKFTVVASSGNTTVGGTFTVTDGAASITDDSATTNAVVDVLSVNASTSGTVANNFGVGLTFDAEDLGGIEEQGSIDLVFTDVTDASEDTQFEFRIQEAGTITQELTVAGGGISLATGSTVNAILDQDDMLSDSDTALATQQSIKAYVDSEISGVTANTLDSAYDEGGAGAGRTITVDTGAVVLDGSNASDETLEVSRETSTTNAVIDAMLIQAETSGSAANNLGAGLVFNVEDAGGIEEQGSIDLVVTNVTDTSEESQFVFNVQDAGAVGARLTVAGDGITLTSGATVDDIETTLSAAENTHIPTSKAVADYVAANGDNLGDHTATTTLTLGTNDIDGTNFDVTGSNGNTTIGGTLDVSGATGIDGDFDINTTSFTVNATSGNTSVGGTLTAAGNTVVTDGTLSVTDDNAATAAVVDVLSVNASSTGTVAANFGVGLTFDAEDLGGIEEQGSIDLVFTDVTDASEDTQFEFRVQEAGAITAELTVAGGGITLGAGATVNDIETTVTDDDTHLPTSGAVFDYVASEISSSSVFEAGDTGTQSVQANNGAADANGDYSLAAGSGTATGNYTFAVGDSTTATGASSVAAGDTTTATGNGSVAIGVDGEAKSYGEVVLGIFADGSGYTANSTTAHNASDRLFVLGNGTASGSRDNALVILKSGNATADGNWDFDGLSLAGGDTMTSILDEDTLSSDSATALATQQSIKAYVDANGADNLGDHTATQALVMGGFDIDGTNFDVDGSNGNTTVGGTLTVSGATATVSDGTLSVTDDNAATAAVVDVLSVNASSTGTVAANFGVGLTFDAEDLGGIEEQGSIDLVFTDVTDASEDTQFEFRVQEAGAITAELTVAGGGISLETGATVNDISDDTDLTDSSATALVTENAVKTYVDAQVGGIGNTLDEAYDQGGAGSGKLITVDSGAVDFAGTNASEPTIDVSREVSAQNAVQDVAFFEVSSSGGAGLAGIGAGLSFRVEDGGDIEEQASIDVVVNTVTDTAEESEITFSVQSAGTITEIANVDSAGFDVTGNITATGTITSSSDETLKTNINGLENALASVLQINGVSFDWVGAPETENGANIGVIAQNVETVYPELVSDNEAGLTVNYGGLVAPLIEAVKELKAEKDAEIEALQAQIAELQAQLSE